jgi:hypothetical protein
VAGGAFGVETERGDGVALRIGLRGFEEGGQAGDEAREVGVAVEESVACFGGPVGEGGTSGEVMAFEEGFQLGGEVCGGTGAKEGTDGEGIEGEREVIGGEDEGRVEGGHGAQALAGGAGAMGAVGAEGAGFEGLKATAAIGAGEGRAEEPVGPGGGVGVVEGEDDGAVAKLEGAVNAFGQAGADAFADDEAIDDGLNGVLAIAIEWGWGLADVEDLAIDAGADEAGATDRVERLGLGSLAGTDERSEDDDLAALGEVEGAGDDLLRRLVADREAAVGAMGLAGAGVEEAEVVVDLGEGANGAAGIGGAGVLLDGDSGWEAVDRLDLGSFELVEELAGVDGEAFDVASLALGVDGVEREGALAGTADAGEDDEAVARKINVNAAEVVDSGVADADPVGWWGR